MEDKALKKAQVTNKIEQNKEDTSEINKLDLAYLDWIFDKEWLRTKK